MRAAHLAREGDLVRSVSISHYLIVRRQIVRVNEMQMTKAERKKETIGRTERVTTRSASEEIINYPGIVCVN